MRALALNLLCRPCHLFLGPNQTEKEKKVYYLLEYDLSSGSVFEENISQNQSPSFPAKYKIWDQRIKEDFEIWLEVNGYMQSTINIYSATVNRLFQRFESLANRALVSSDSPIQAARLFTTLVGKTLGEQPEKAQLNHKLSILGTFERFLHNKESTPASTNESNLSNIIDYEVGSDRLREIFEGHFLALDGYSNCILAWDAAQKEIPPMFLNDNAINSERDLWDFIVAVFGSEYVLNYPHIWQRAPDHSQNTQGLIVNLARQCGGVIAKTQIEAFLEKVKLSPLTNAQILQHNIFLFYEKGIFILTEFVKPTNYFYRQIKLALDGLFAAENKSYIILRDISEIWFSHLPEFDNFISWTSMLLQELLGGMNESSGYKVIFFLA